MSKRIGESGLLLLAVLLAASAMAVPGGDPADVAIEGSIGLDVALANSCIAVWVPLGENLAINGVMWYNNDGMVAFPEILVQGGFASQATSLSGAISVATNVVGSSSGWSEMTFSQPITTDNDGLYVIFRIPEGTSATSDGAGGGPAIGYTRVATGCTGWLSADGEDWMQIHPSFGLAMLPTIVPAVQGMAAKSNAAPSGRKTDPVVDPGVDDGVKPEVLTTVTWLSPASPNPFNPRTSLSFTLVSDEAVSLSIYSVRGELVKQLVSERRGAGGHTAVWDGTDGGGRSVSSGVYLARFVAGSVIMTQRLVLMR